MKLSRLTVCQVFPLRAPIWNGGKKVAGLNIQRIGDHNEITFSYVRKSDGERSFPDSYYISRKKIQENEYPTQFIKGVTLLLIPFSDLEILERE